MNLDLRQRLPEASKQNPLNIREYAQLDDSSVASSKSVNIYTFEPELPISNTNFNPLKVGDDSIDQLNLNRIIAKSLDLDSGYGWDISTALQLADMYRAFLFLCKNYPHEIIVPIREVDEFWHLHILDTRNYAVDCQNVFGNFLHHFPYAGLPGAGSSSHDEELYMEKTLELIGKHFPQFLESES